MGFGAIDAQEVALGQAITAVFARYDSTHSFELQSALFDEANALLLRFREFHQARARLVRQGVDTIWVKSMGTQAELKLDSPVTLARLTDEYRFFTDMVLNLSSMEEGDVFSIRALVFKIMSRPLGQRLILNLNRLSRANTSRIIVKYGDDLSVGIGDSVDLAGKCVDFENTYFVDEKNQWDAGLYRTHYKQYLRKGEPLSAVVLSYPKKLFERSLAISAGIDTHLVCSIPYIGFAHELIHAMHCFRGKNRGQMMFRHSGQSPLYHLYAHSALFGQPEEFWTVELAKLSENGLRKEHDLPARGSHRAAMQNSSRFFKHLDVIVMLATRRRACDVLNETDMRKIITY